MVLEVKIFSTNNFFERERSIEIASTIIFYPVLYKNLLYFSRHRDKDDAKCARRFSDYCGDVTGGKCSSKYPCPIKASKEARKAAFDKRRSKRIAAVVQEVDLGESPESKSAALASIGGGEHIITKKKIHVIVGVKKTTTINR